MDARSEQGRWLDRPLEVLSRVSSADRGWAGFSASLIHVAGGTSMPATLARHNVTMLVGQPLRTVARCDETMDARLQRPGEFDILPARSSVEWVDQGSSLFLAVGLQDDLIATTAIEMGLDPDRVGFVPQLTCRDPQIEHLLWALKAELESQAPYGRIYADSLGIALASQLLRRWSRVAREPLAAGLPDRELKRVLSYIHEQLGAGLTVATVANVAGVSPSHLNVRFKQSMGTSVHQYILRKRVERAAELLARTQLSICDVALQSGFANQSHMALLMRRFIGVTPGRLRAAR
ncbi:MAG TPA: AraC family transcriptional regulator [Candidatus Cybelea sp.]|nr:AraC family transcriptional regulator [Candidatus Cybelea sp.]